MDLKLNRKSNRVVPNLNQIPEQSGLEIKFKTHVKSKMTKNKITVRRL